MRTCVRNANRRLISSNIALQWDLLRESKGTKKRHRGLSSAGCGGSESTGNIQQMGRRLRQAKAIPKKLLEKWCPQLFEGPLERSPAAKSQSQGLLHPLRQNGDRLTSATKDGAREEFPSRSGCRCPTASAYFSDKRDKLQPFSGARGFGVVVGTLTSFVVCRRPGTILSRASDRPTRSPEEIARSKTTAI